MNTRLTIDFKDPGYLKRLKHVAAEENKTVREIVVTALDSYFLHYLENRAISKLAEEAFAEWDNSLDAQYDKI